jgi:hypothetical protein
MKWWISVSLLLVSTLCLVEGFFLLPAHAECKPSYPAQLVPVTPTECSRFAAKADEEAVAHSNRFKEKAASIKDKEKKAYYEVLAQDELDSFKKYQGVILRDRAKSIKLFFANQSEEGCAELMKPKEYCLRQLCCEACERSSLQSGLISSHEILDEKDCAKGASKKKQGLPLSDPNEPKLPNKS